MNSSELEKLLKSTAPPEHEPEFWEQLPRRITAKLHSQASLAPAVVVRPGFRWRPLAWGFSAGLACLVIGFALGNWRGTKFANGLLENEKLVREVLAMFPNQVQAIIQDENGLRLALADEANVPQFQPLWLKVCDGEQCRSIVTFSGQSVQIAGQRVEVLADARGGVMLVGDHFVWAGGEIARGERLRIEAHPLNQVL